jgi:hypothetical protein
VTLPTKAKRNSDAIIRVRSRASGIGIGVRIGIAVTRLDTMIIEKVAKEGNGTSFLGTLARVLVVRFGPMGTIIGGPSAPG